MTIFSLLSSWHTSLDNGFSPGSVNLFKRKALQRQTHETTFMQLLFIGKNEMETHLGISGHRVTAGGNYMLDKARQGGLGRRVSAASDAESKC